MPVCPPSRRSGPAALLPLLFALTAACGGDPAGSTPATTDASAADAADAAAACPGGAGCLCAHDGLCPTWSACVEHADGKRCATACQAGACGPGEICTTVFKTDAAGNPVTVQDLCIPRAPRACDPCISSSTCSTAGDLQAACVDVDGSGGKAGFFCAASCQAAADCPAAHECVEATDTAGAKAKYCLPASRECVCSPVAVTKGLQTTCLATSADGRVAGACAGTRKCGSDGLGACTAPAPAAETCNGLDDDCNGTTDEGTASECADADPCTDDVCQGASGCGHPANTAACDDGSACTAGDVCNCAPGAPGGATCQCAGAAVPCDDGNPCTDDACDPAVGCTTTDNTAACSDGEPCTGPDACLGGACGGPAVSCDDGNVCTTDFCLAKQGCDHEFAALSCDDGEVCTAADSCNLGACVGDAVACDDGWGCTVDSCVPGQGCTAKAGPDPQCGQATLPYVHALGCGGPGVGAWQLGTDGGVLVGSAAAPGVKWQLAPVPVDLAGSATGCALTLNNGKDLQCGEGQGKVEATAATPTFDASALPADAVLVVRFESAGIWPADAKAEIQTSTDGKAWTTVGAVPASGAVWGKVQIKLGALGGQEFQVRWLLSFASCAAGQGHAGWFVRKLVIMQDVCPVQNGGCSPDATCEMGDAGLPVCTCLPGYAGDGVSCPDVDECQAGSDDCHADAACTNTKGGFACQCLAGYTGDGKSCLDVDECQLGTAGCSAEAICANTQGGATCTCKPGWAGDGKTCADVDECAMGIAGCSPNATCSNTTGGFACQCKAGFQGDGKTCQDVDECAAGTAGCSPNATCVNTTGGATCTCKSGFSGDGKLCLDVNECQNGTAGCAAQATCANTTGGFTCTCNQGYTGNGKTCTPLSLTTCAAWKAYNPAAGSGKYLIDTDGAGPKAAIQAWCDMGTAGGPYTWVRIDSGALGGDQNAYAAVCAQYGMEVVVPRNQAHAAALQAQLGVIPNLVNVFPKWNGATGLSNWQGLCKGAPCGFWISSSNNAECGGDEPNGDNNTAYRIYRWGNGCSWGRWNDANNAVAMPGWVVCSTNDK